MFVVTRAVNCKTCGADEWRRRRRRGTGFGYDCGPCARRRNRWRRADPVQTMYDLAKQRAKKSRTPFSITVEDVRCVFPADFCCPVFGLPFKLGRAGVADPASPSLDRIDPAKGYVPGNIAVISRRANTIKNDATLGELERITSWLRKQGIKGENLWLDPS